MKDFEKAGQSDSPIIKDNCRHGGETVNMKVTEDMHVPRVTLTISGIIFYICAIYFFLMGLSLILIPDILVKGFSDINVNQKIIGMLRGAGGSILPYSLLYVMIARNPFKRIWALYIILAANITAIILDLFSVLKGEYTLSNAMLDIPFELLSIIGVILILMKYKNK